MRSSYLALLLVLGLAFGIRFYGLGAQDYWIDEIHSLGDSASHRAEFESIAHGVIHLAPPRFTDLTSDSTFSQMWRGMEADSHPPMYFAFFRAWRLLIGDGELAARVPSVIFSLASVMVVALIAAAYGRPRHGVWIALILALSYSHIHMAQHARPYALALFLVSVSYWSLVKMDPRRSGRRMAVWVFLYGLTTYLAVMTHYFAGFALLGQVLVVAASREKVYARTWLLVVSVTVVAFLVTWSRPMAAQIDFIQSHTWLLDESTGHIG